MNKRQQSLLWLKGGVRVGLLVGGLLGTVIGAFNLPDFSASVGIIAIILPFCLAFGALCSVTVPWLRSRTLAGILPGALLALSCAILTNDARLLILAIPTCLFGLLINTFADPRRRTPEYRAALEADPSANITNYPKGLLVILVVLVVFSSVCRLIRPLVNGYHWIKSTSQTTPLAK